MRRRELLKAGAGAAGAIFLGPPARGDDPIADSDLAVTLRKFGSFGRGPLETSSLGGGLRLVAGAGGNIAVLTGPDGSVVIDAGLPFRGDEVFATAKKLGDKPVSLLINTHWHFDHSGGNALFGKAGTRIVATPNTLKRLSTDQYTEAFKITTPALPPEARPTVTFEEADIHAGDETLHLFAVPPAHTDGDLVIHFLKADVVHTGDLFSNGVYPNIDASSKGWIGGMIAAADRILKVAGPKTRVIPGHGPLSTADDLKAFRTMLVTVYDRMAPMVDAGKSLDEVLLARTTNGFDAKLGQGVFNGPGFARLVYGGLVKHREDTGK